MLRKNLPEEFRDKEHGERDYYICLDYASGQKAEEIVVNRKLSITSRRVEQITSQHGDFIIKNIKWGKAKRLSVLMQVAEEAGVTLSNKKDILNVIEQFRKELEGEKDHNVTINNVTYVRTNRRDPLSTTTLPGRDTRISEKI